MTTPSELDIEVDVDWASATPYRVTGAPPTWGTNYQATVTAVNISRGRTNLFDPVATGRCTVELLNSTGTITPLSATYTDGKPLRVTCPDDSGTRQDLFVGTVAPGGLVWSGDIQPVVTVTAQDMVGLVLQTPGGLPGSSSGTELEGWIGAWFDARSWSTPWPGYDVDTGVAEVTNINLEAANLSADGILRAAAESEGGVIYCTRGGVFTGDNRHAPRAVTRQRQVQWRFGDETARAADPGGVIGIRLESMQVTQLGGLARVTVSHAAGNTVVESPGPTVGAVVGTATVDSGTVGFTARAAGKTLERTTKLVDAIGATTLGQFWLDQSKDPAATFGPATFTFACQGHGLSLRAATQIELRDRVQVTWTFPGGVPITRLLFVEQITHRITPGVWTVTVGCSSADAWVTLGGDSWGLVGEAIVGTATAAY